MVESDVTMWHFYYGIFSERWSCLKDDALVGDEVVLLGVELCHLSAAQVARSAGDAANILNGPRRSVCADIAVNYSFARFPSLPRLEALGAFRWPASGCRCRIYFLSSRARLFLILDLGIDTPRINVLAEDWTT